MFRISYIILLLLIAGAQVQAQGDRFEVTGTVVDTTEVGLSGATVMVMAPDSTLISFGITRPDGRFRLDRVPAGDHLLEVTFVGFEPYSRPITLTDRAIDVGTIVLRESLLELEELVVTAEHIPLLVRRDTLDYNASAFRVPPNANVEELLRRLPGIEVERDGTIRAQGEVVRRLLVDGREFFGSDPTVATRNLPADAVDRVQVYDRKSDTAELTGIDDGQRERTINLQLKEDRRRGTFGNLSGALGDPSRYETRGSVHRFSPRTQISVIGNLNNINQQGFQYSDYTTFMGGPDRATMNQRLVPLGWGASDGFSTTRSGGVNLSTDLGARTTLRTSYLAYFLDRDQDMVALQRELAGGLTSAFTSETEDTRRRQRSHRLQLNAEHEFGEAHNVRLEAFANIGGTTSESMRSRTTERPEDASVSTNQRRYDWTSSTLSSDATLTYRRRLAPGRTVVAEARTAFNDYHYDTDLDSETALVRDGNLLTAEEVRRIQDQQRYILSHSQKLTYTEPLGRRQLLEFELEHRAVLEDRDYATFDIVDGEHVVNLPQSLAFDRTYRYLRGGTAFRRSVDPLTLSLGAVVQQANLLGQTIGQDAELDSRFVRLLPNASVRYAFSQSHHVQLTYTTSTREPSIRDLQPFVDTSDPMHQYVGNPGIRPQYQHMLRLNYGFFDAFTSTNVWVNAAFTHHLDAIVRSRWVHDDLTQTSSVVNADGTWSLNVWANLGRPLRSLGIRPSFRLGPTFSREMEFLNHEANVSHLRRTSATLSVDNIKRNVIEAHLSATYTFNDVRYTLNPHLNQSYVNRTVSGSFQYRFAEGWRVGAGLDYHLYAAEISGAHRSVPLLRSHISWEVPRSRAELRLEGHDLLDQNLGVTFTNTASHIREQRTASLGRFVMLRMVYNLSGQRDGEPRVVRM